MKLVNLKELKRINGGVIRFMSMNSKQISVLVTGSSRFFSGGVLNGQKIEAIFYSDGIHNLDDHSLNYNLNEPIYHHGHLITCEPVDDGFIYHITFNQQLSE